MAILWYYQVCISELFQSLIAVKLKRKTTDVVSPRVRHPSFSGLLHVMNNHDYDEGLSNTEAGIYMA